MTNQIKLQSSVDGFWRIFFTAIIAVTALIMPEMAAAAGAGAATSFGTFDTVMCNVLQALTGTPAKVIATLGIVFLGIGAFFGKLNWGTALLFGVGIIAIFAAPAIVRTLSFGGGLGNNVNCAVL